MQKTIIAPIIHKKIANFPSLDEVLEEFITDNGLPFELKTVIETESRGLLIHLDNGDTFNLYSYENDLSAYNHQIYGLQGRIDGERVHLRGDIQIPNHQSQIREELINKVYRSDHNISFVFLGIQAKSKDTNEYLNNQYNLIGLLI